MPKDSDFTARSGFGHIPTAPNQFSNQGSNIFGTKKEISKSPDSSTKGIGEGATNFINLPDGAWEKDNK